MVEALADLFKSKLYNMSNFYEIATAVILILLGIVAVFLLCSVVALKLGDIIASENCMVVCFACFILSLSIMRTAFLREAVVRSTESVEVQYELQCD